MVSPAPAAAARTGRSTNSDADGFALTAYHVYLSSLAAGAQSAAARASLVIDGVSDTCPDVLDDLAKLSAGQLEKSALTAFGQEVDADLEIAYVSGNTSALSRFANVLDGLTWSTPAQYNTTIRLISSERALIGMTPSNLCEDATSLDAAPLSEPTTTRRFLGRYRAASAALNSALSAFESLLAEFETKSETKVVAQIDVLVSQYAAQSSSTEQSDATAVLSELGVSS